VQKDLELNLSEISVDWRTLEVKFKNMGLDSIEVSDNGSGIPSEDYASLGQLNFLLISSIYLSFSQEPEKADLLLFLQL